MHSTPYKHYGVCSPCAFFSHVRGPTATGAILSGMVLEIVVAMDLGVADLALTTVHLA